MTRDELIIATSLILFAAFVLGWLCCWLVGRLTRPGRAELDGVQRLAADLHEAEAARDRIVSEAKEREAALHERLAFSASELASTRATLQEAGEEIEELRAYIDRHIAR